MQKQLAQWNHGKTRFLIFALIGLYLLLFLPFWQSVVLGFLFAAACEPVVNMIRRRLHAKRTKVAYLTVGLALTFFIGLIALVILQGYTQIYDAFRNQEAMGGVNEKIASVRDSFLAWADRQSFLESVNIKAQLDRAVITITNATKSLLLAGASGFVQSAPAILLQLFIFLLAFGAFLVVQPRIWASTALALGLGDKGTEHFKRFERICGLALGSILITGFIQSILVTIGAAIAGYESLLMIFGITFIFAMIPLLGAGLVPAFLCILGFIQGDMKTGIVMLITATIVGIADNIIRAWLFSRAAKSNPAISIISLLGGITLFGFPGLFIAPVIEQLVMTYAFSSEGEPETHEITANEEPVHPDKLVRQHDFDRDLSPRPT